MRIPDEHEAMKRVVTHGDMQSNVWSKIKVTNVTETHRRLGCGGEVTGYSPRPVRILDNTKCLKTSGEASSKIFIKKKDY